MYIYVYMYMHIYLSIYLSVDRSISIYISMDKLVWGNKPFTYDLLIFHSSVDLFSFEN